MLGEMISAKQLYRTQASKGKQNTGPHFSSGGLFKAPNPSCALSIFPQLSSLS